MAFNSKKHMIKTLVLGNSGAGKTSSIQRYANNVFKKSYTATASVEFETKEILVDGKVVSLQIWDTFGERFQELGNSYYRGVDCCVLVFDITNRGSFESLDTWRNNFIMRREVQDPKTFPFIVLDLADLRQVTTKEAQEWCERNGNIPYFEVSAKEDQGLSEAFQVAAKSAVAQHKDDEFVPQAVKLKSQTHQKPPSSGCTC